MDYKEFGDYFNHPIYKRLKTNEDVICNFLTTENFTEEGVIQCGKCKSKRVFMVGKQVRAADEPMTTFCFCANCRSRWTE